jgi:DNA-binding SARP family transcriptional activator/predicted negative regulator of RcsB-dependent stress response
VVIEIRLLGRFSVRRAGEELPPAAFHGRMVRTLLRFLLTRRGQFVPRDVLAEALWPGMPPADPSTNLNVLINRARRALGDSSLILTSPGGYSFSADARCVVDAEMFLSRLEQARTLMASGQPAAALKEFRSALGLWGGEPLPEDAYEDWAQDYRGRLTRAYVDALEGGAAAALTIGDVGQAVGLAEQAVVQEPLRESGNLLLVRALARSGDTPGALKAFERFRHHLSDETGLDPSQEARELEMRVLRGEPLGPSLQRTVFVHGSAEFKQPGFVNREEEILALLDALTRPVPVPAVVSGPAGSGKSRLLAEVAARAGVPVVSARAFPAEREEAWSLGRTLLEQALTVDMEAARSVPERAAQALADIVPELEELRPIGSSPLDPETRRALALQGSVRLTQALAAKGTLMVVDDIQWADSTSLQLLGQSIRRIKGLAMLLAYRPEEVSRGAPVASLLSELQGEEQLMTVPLGPLPEDAISQIISDEPLATAIATETDRTPVAVMEVIRALASKGAIQPSLDGRWQPSSPEAVDLAREAAKAGQIRSIQGRAEREPPARREILHLLSLLGREVPARVLALASGRDQVVTLEDLESLARAELVQLGEQGWAIAHDFVRRSIGKSLHTAERARLHEMLAQALRAEGTDPAELARHLASAGDHKAAAEAFLQAAQERLDRFASEEAEQLADAGLRLGPGREVRSTLLEIRGEARSRRGDIWGAREDLRSALGLKQKGADRARILARLAMLISGAEDYRQADELVELALTEGVSDPRARAEALSVGAIVDANIGRYHRAEARSAEALSLFEQLGDAAGVAAVLDARGTCFLGEGRITEALAMYERAARFFINSGQLLRLGTTRSQRALGLVYMGKAEQALADLDEVLELERMLGHAEGECWALGIRVLALIALNRPEEARATAERTLKMALQLRHKEFIVAARALVGRALAASGELDKAEAVLRQCIQESADLPIFFSWAAARLASVLVACGNLSEAEAWVSHALKEATPLTLYEARVSQAELAFARGDPDASRIADEARILAEAGGHLLSAAQLKKLADGGFQPRSSNRGAEKTQ